MRIYVAGPYSTGDVALNVRAAVEAADALAAAGHVPYLPHLTHLWHLVSPHEYEFWLGYDEAWLRLCEAVVRLPGVSAGADRETDLAEALGMTVYASVEDVPTPALSPCAP